ncbi:GDP-mannose 4,6-dehydratase [compost metagenome]
MKEFVDIAAKKMGFNLKWTGDGVDTKAYDQEGRCVVAVDPRYFRPTEVETLLGDATKAKKKLGWTPRTSFETLVDEMVKADLILAERETKFPSIKVVR